MALTHRQLEAFHVFMETGTVTGAADRLRISQPAVSKILAALEYDLKLKLFKRVRKRLVPTNEALAAQAAPPPSRPAPPAANGQAPGRKGKAKSPDQDSGWCSIHNVSMDLHQNERGTWHSHWDDENQEYCRGAK